MVVKGPKVLDGMVVEVIGVVAATVDELVGRAPAGTTARATVSQFAGPVKKTN